MLFHAFAVTAIGLGWSAATLGPPAPVTTKYKLEIKAETSVDLSAFGQGTQVQNANLTTWLNLTLNDSAGGKSVYVLIDSIAYDGTAPVPQASVDSARRAVVRGFVDKSGRVQNLTATPGNSLLVGQVQGMINSFFPRIKTGARAGDVWIDTTEVKNAAGGNNTNVTLVINYTAGAGETVAGMPALKVSATTMSTITGTLDNPMAGTMEVEGTGTGTGTLFIGADGRILGATSTSNIDQKLKTSMAPAPIPVKTVQTVILTLLR